MTATISRTGALTPDQRRAVETLVEAVATADGVRPLNEHAGFALAGTGHAVHWLAHEGCQLVGYGQTDRDQESMQLLVHPDHRRKGVGAQLVATMGTATRGLHWWAFGHLPAARGLAQHLGLGLQRELLVMERDLVANPVALEPAPEGIELRPFRPSDVDALLDVNSEAFADHPEQGQMDADDFTRRSQEDWFDPEGLLVAIDEETGALLGFHWTKTEAMDPARPDELVGEVYVIAVRSDAAGRGLGRALLTAGLKHLSDKGVRRVRLYVEGNNERVVKMYRSASFEPVASDAAYA